MSQPDPRIVLGVKQFNHLSHKHKVAYRKLAKKHDAVLFTMTYNFGAEA